MKKLQKTIGLIAVAFLMVVLLSPRAFAMECDEDKDGYIALTQDMLEVVVEDNAFRLNGNYPPEQWAGIFQTYKNGIETDTGLDSSYMCDSLGFKKGAEPSRCDQIVLSGSSGVFDTAKVQTLNGNKVNPSTFDAPNNGIDEDCDGADGTLLDQTGGTTKDLGQLVQKGIALLARAVVVISIVVLIWGGILYATAAGDEFKTAKARKAIIGAIIGLAVGLLAPTIVNYVASSLA
ncbi:MAG: pilin [Candidatus Peregrinibacteria bacterium]